MKKQNRFWYLVVRKTDGKKFVMDCDLKNPENVGGGKYLYDIVDNCKRIKTPYGYMHNISTGVKYNSTDYKIVHCTRV